MKSDDADRENGASRSTIIKRSVNWSKKNLGKPDRIGLPLVLISFLFFTSLIVTPLMVDKNTIDLGDQGSVGKNDHDEMISDINNSFAKAIYRFGDRYCHQKDHRSWEINGNQMPVCARDIGLFLGIFIGCIFGASYKRGIKLLILLGLLVPMAIDGGLQALTSYESFNLLRLLTGMIAGFGVGAYVNGSAVETIRILTFKRKKG
jgi:uncharacterized membrane protein